MLKTLLKVQFAALKASLLRSRRKQTKGGTGRTIGFAVLFLYVIICFFYHVRQHVFFYLHAAA